MCGFESHLGYMSNEPLLDVLVQVELLRQLAEEHVRRAEEKGIPVIRPYMTSDGRAATYLALADGLERGYRLGRVKAAVEVRFGLETPRHNGSVCFDSDVKGPPRWLIETAEQLARGDA